MLLVRILALLALIVAGACSSGEAPEDAASPEARPRTDAPAAVPAEPCVEDASGSASIDRLPGTGSALSACAVRTLLPERAGGRAVVTGPANAAVGVMLAVRTDAALLVADGDTQPVLEELGRLAADEIHALGASTRSLPGIEHEVVGGHDPVTNAVAVAERHPGDGPAVVASVERPLEAALAAVFAAREDGILLLASGGQLSGDASRLAQSSQRVVLVGGYDTLGEDVGQRLRSAGVDVRRISGPGASGLAASIARIHPSEGPRLLVDPGDPTAGAVAAWHVSRTGGAVVPVGPEGPDGDADRWLRVDGLAGGSSVRLVGDALGGGVVAAMEERLAEAAAGGPPPEFRGVWVHLFDDTLKSRRGIDEMLDRVAAANMNAVIVEIIRRHDAYHRSEVLPRTPDPALEADLDVLQHVIDGARQRGLQVHAWAPAMPAYHHVYDGLELPAGHVWREHGPGSDQPWVTFDHGGRPSPEFLDPGVPAVADHVVAMYRELAERYDIDGVHLDYVRYDSRQWGYNPVALERFRAETGRGDRPSPSDEQWSDWRRAQTRSLAERISDAVHGADPEVALTLAGSTIGAAPASPSGYRDTRTFADVFQQWPDWLADGVIDAVFPMHYFRDSDTRQRAWFRGWLAFDEQLAARCREQRQTGCVIAIGIGAWLNHVNDGLTQVEAARARTDGAVIYSYQQSAAGQPTDALLRALPQGPFSEPAPAPALR